jgi:hypothetical protein
LFVSFFKCSSAVDKFDVFKSSKISLQTAFPFSAVLYILVNWSL